MEREDTVEDTVIELGAASVETKGNERGLTDMTIAQHGVGLSDD